MGTVLSESLVYWQPEMILAAGALFTLLVGVFLGQRRPVWWVAGLTLVLTAIFLLRTPVSAHTAVFFDLIVCDRFAYAFRWIALGCIAITALLMAGSEEVAEEHTGEYAALLMLLGLGLMVMAEANHWLMVYLGIELVGLSSFLLVGFARERRSGEAALKYLLFGALSSGFMLMGIAWFYGITGSLTLADTAAALSALGSAETALLLVAAVFVFIGLAYKISLVPFHFWTPDAYEGAPIAVAALLSVGPKAAGLALLLRVLTMLGPLQEPLYGALLALTLVTMTLGNVVALVQTNVKRLLAYSTIGQVGYILMGLLARTELGTQSVLLYLVAYVFMNLGAFACLGVVYNARKREDLGAFAGLAQREPLLALCCTLCLLSLAGIPPLLGFLGKFFLFGAALDAHLPILAFAAVINSAIALYYYVAIIRQMYLVDPAEGGRSPVALSLRLALWGCAVATLALGVFPQQLIAVLQKVAESSIL